MNPCFQDVLVVDGDYALCTSLSRILTSAGFTVRTAANGTEAIRALEERYPYFVIFDWRASRMDGIELCRQIRSERLPHYIYLMLLSENYDYNDVATGFMSGADDFAAKPVQRRELLARLEAGARVLEIEQRLTQLASFDNLTNSLNRRMGMLLLDKEWSRASRYEHPISCALWDLDHLGRINETYGHAAGDEALRAIARLAEATSRRADYVCRWSDDEFLTIMPETNEAGASCWAQRLASRIATMDFTFHGQRISLTASFGIAERIESMKSPQELVDAAEEAMYAAKKAGEHQIVTAQSLHIASPEDATLCTADA